MKRFLILVLFLFSVYAIAKNDVNFHKFSDAMTENIDTVIKHNPQIYETMPSSKSRAPASVEIIDETVEDAQERIDTFDKQNVGHKNW